MTSRALLHGLSPAWLSISVLGVPVARAEIPVEAVTAEVRSHVAARLSVHESDVEVGFPGLVSPLPCVEGAELQVTASPGERFRGHPNLRLRATEPDGRVCADLRIRPELRIWTLAPVAAAPAAAGEPVTVRLGRLSLDQIDGTLIPVEPGQVDSARWEARGPLQQGEPLTLQRVRPTPAGRQGGEVRLVATSGPLVVQTTGRLFEDVQLGEEVRVTNLATGVVVKGVLVEPGLVQAGARP